MDDNSLLVIILAFVLGCMCSGMMNQMCGGRLVEGSSNRCRGNISLDDCSIYNEDKCNNYFHTDGEFSQSLNQCEWNGESCVRGPSCTDSFREGPSPYQYM